MRKANLNPEKVSELLGTTNPREDDFRQYVKQIDNRGNRVWNYN